MTIINYEFNQCFKYILKSPLFSSLNLHIPKPAYKSAVPVYCTIQASRLLLTGTL